MDNYYTVEVYTIRKHIQYIDEPQVNQMVKPGDVCRIFKIGAKNVNKSYRLKLLTLYKQERVAKCCFFLIIHV